MNDRLPARSVTDPKPARPAIPNPFFTLWGPLALIAAVAATGLALKYTSFERTEILVSMWLTDHQAEPFSTGAHLIAVGLSAPFALVIASCITIGTWIHFGGRRAARFAWLTFISWAAAAIAKPIVTRPRPDAALLTDPIAPRLGALSFPSGHTAFATALFLAIALTFVKRSARNVAFTVAALAVLLVAASRVYVGAHFVTDVLAGAIAAAAGTRIALTLWTYRLRPRFEQPRYGTRAAGTIRAGRDPRRTITPTDGTNNG